MADDDALILPVGHCLGASWWPDTGVVEQQVRRGFEVARLAPEVFGVWALAHGVPDRSPAEVWTAGAVLDLADELGVAEPEPLLAALLDDGLLVEVAPTEAARVGFARGHRMVPLMLGLGNTAEEQEVFQVGLPGRPLLGVPPVAYDLFAWAHLDPDLWTACQAAAEINQRLRPDDPTATEPGRLVGALLDFAHVLLGPNAVYFDVARDDG
jgi:hypothetical protein